MLILKLQDRGKVSGVLFCALKTFLCAMFSGTSLWKGWKQWFKLFQIICLSFHVLLSLGLEEKNLGGLMWWKIDQRIAKDLGLSLKAVLISPSMKIHPPTHTHTVLNKLVSLRLNDPQISSFLNQGTDLANP